MCTASWLRLWSWNNWLLRCVCWRSQLLCWSMRISDLWRQCRIHLWGQLLWRMQPRLVRHWWQPSEMQKWNFRLIFSFPFNKSATHWQWNEQGGDCAAVQCPFIQQLCLCGETTIDCCPACIPTVECFVNPCENVACAGHSDYTCEANYCGGCNRNWINRNGDKVECEREIFVSLPKNVSFGLKLIYVDDWNEIGYWVGPWVCWRHRMRAPQCGTWICVLLWGNVWSRRLCHWYLETSEPSMVAIKPCRMLSKLWSSVCVPPFVSRFFINFVTLDQVVLLTFLLMITLWPFVRIHSAPKWMRVFLLLT